MPKCFVSGQFYTVDHSTWSHVFGLQCICRAREWDGTGGIVRPVQHRAHYSTCPGGWLYTVYLYTVYLQLPDCIQASTYCRGPSFTYALYRDIWSGYCDHPCVDLRVCVVCVSVYLRDNSRARRWMLPSLVYMGTVTAGAQKVCKSELISYLKRQI